MPATAFHRPDAGNPEPDSPLNDLRTGVVVGDNANQITDLNSAAESALGISRNRAIGAKFSELFIVGCTEVGHIVDKAKFRHGAVIARGLGLANGRFDCAASRRANGGFVVELISVDWSISALNAASQVSRHSAIENLLRGLAHEVNNPLGGVRGAAQLLEQHLSDPGLLEYTQLIVGEVDRLATLVQRVTQSRSVTRREPLNIHEVCERVRFLIESDSQNSMAIERDYDPSLPDIHGDRDLLIQAVLNLARNAVQAGAEKLWLRTRIARNQLIGEQLHPLALCIQVIDNGPGIDPKFVDSMFYPLISGKRNGSGIGLAQAQSAAVAHGGLIECSRHRKPTRFTLMLPVTGS